MELYWYGALFILGAIIGSFLNVVLYRLHTGRSLNGRSHCMTCGKELLWYELIPIVSYIVQRGACRGCGAYVPSRYLFVELLTGVLFLLVYHLFSFSYQLLFIYLALSVVLILIVVYDIRHTIIPNELSFLTFLIALLFMGYEIWTFKTGDFLVPRILAGLGAGFFFYALWFISHGRWIGLGDAKLALPLGMIVGTSGVFSMVVLSFWIGAAISVVLLFITKYLMRGKIRLHFRNRGITMKSEVPFAPFLVLGFLLVQFFHADIFNITNYIFSF